MSKLTYSAGDVTLRMDDTLERMVDQVLDGMIPSTRRALEEHTSDLLEAAQAAWPVKSGYSRSQLERGFTVRRDAVVAFITNTADYAWHVKGRRQGGKRTWTELISKPARKRRAELVEIAGRELLRLHEVR